MNRIAKLPLLVLVAVLVVSTTLSALLTCAQSIPKPTVPEFTIASVDKSFTTTDGVYYESKTIQVTVKNQLSLNNSLFYNVRFRINVGDWMDIYTMDDAYPLQSDSEYTIISVYLNPQGNDTIVPTDSVVDVQVEAMIGYIHREYNPNHTSQLDMYPYVFTGETSGWSSTQTITIPAASFVTPNSTDNLPNRGPTSPPNSDSDLALPLALVAVVVFVIILFSLLLHVRHLKRSSSVKI